MSTERVEEIRRRLGDWYPGALTWQQLKGFGPRNWLMSDAREYVNPVLEFLDGSFAAMQAVAAAKRDLEYLLTALAQAEQRIKELEDTVCDDAVHQALVAKVAQAERELSEIRASLYLCDQDRTRFAGELTEARAEVERLKRGLGARGSLHDANLCTHFLEKERAEAALARVRALWEEFTKEGSIMVYAKFREQMRAALEGR